ncbi:DUF92 domain-containing protein [Paenibacillus sp. MER TA 81-3]|uniref:DUF92 domain-containing protein n=1 Tax=Paenibacillus sp. MER TA 81-3 TaxID=2939573 RepID=UPI00203EFF30|nr:DUF92 domain-containing protein [Paenibacillus sp. MER TA 81-3]MCM3340417.1 DUF92 domain-containing protein [Paenibacillus sp. MER TA 81-3]
MFQEWMRLLGSISPWLIGFAGSLLVAGAAWWKRSLTKSGAAAAVIMGTIYYGSGDLLWFGLLLTFFVTSTGWSKWKKRMKVRFDELYEKTGERDAGQVLANGGIGMILCLLNYIAPNSIWMWLFIGVMATVNADTWATEIGSLSPKPPRSILTGRIVPAGTSGAVSVIGTLASVAGALTIGIAAVVFMLILNEQHNWIDLGVIIGAAGIGGVAGAMLDSLFGATVQASYRCSKCGADTERTEHCGIPTVLVRGAGWMNNDRVNMITSCAGGAASCLVLLLYGM